MKEYNDGHSSETCNYNKCGGDNPAACPFLRNVRIAVEPYECQHKWRQVRAPDGYIGLMFYCKHCLAIREHDFGDMAE